MTRTGLALGVLLISLVLLHAFPRFSLADEHPCAIVTCDCESIEAGLLNSGWKPDCRSCQAGLIKRCEEAYPPLSSAMSAGGYCERACSVTGPNPYPRPAPEAGDGDEPAIIKVGTMRLQCPFTMTVATATIDGKPAKGCVDEHGKRQGLWFVIDESAGTVTEILYREGEEVDRVTRPIV